MRNLAYLLTTALLPTVFAACDPGVPLPDDDHLVAAAGGISAEDDGSCDEAAASQACALEGGGEGVQYCDTVGEDELAWGACVASPECEPGEVLECGFCDDPESFECEACGDSDATCHLEDGVPTFGEWACACDTPLVLSFDGAPIEMQAAPLATFDISDAGACISTDWPAAATPWLALDLDRSGSIETGRELFGSGTRLASGERADHGFMALSEIDDNGDGVVDVRDARFAELVLWSDANADKVADFSELSPLAMRGVLSLDLAYYGEAHCDDRGNCEGQRAEFTYLAAGGEVAQGEVVDVYLACQ